MRPEDRLLRPGGQLRRRGQVRRPRRGGGRGGAVRVQQDGRDEVDRRDQGAHERLKQGSCGHSGTLTQSEVSDYEQATPLARNLFGVEARGLSQNSQNHRLAFQSVIISIVTITFHIPY